MHQIKLSNMQITLIKYHLPAFVICFILLLTGGRAGAQSHLVVRSEKYQQEQESISRTLLDERKKHEQKMTRLPDYELQQSKDGFFHVRFIKGAPVTPDAFFEKFGKELGVGSGNSYRLLQTNTDTFGYTHQYYSVFYNNIMVEAAQLQVHIKNGAVDWANGKIFTDISLSVHPGITPDVAIQHALKNNQSNQYRWQNEQESEFLKASRNDPSASFYPIPQLMILSDYSVEEGTRHALTYQMDLYSSQPFFEKRVYIDAHTGKQLKAGEMACHIDIPNTVNTLYSGRQTIIADRTRGVSTLRETGRPIRTMNMLNLPDYSKAIDFTTISRNWSARVTKLNTLSVISIGNSWNDVGEDFSRPDLFYEIWDEIRRVRLYQSVTLENLPITNGTVFDLPLNEKRLPEGGLYSIRLYDFDDDSPNDLIISCLFSTITSPQRYRARGGVRVVLNGTIDLTGALDAHYGVEKAYDYFKLKHGRLSYDNLNSEIKIYMHPSVSISNPLAGANNAEWSYGMKHITVWDGDGLNQGSMAAFDVMAHELTHGVINNNGHGGLDPLGSDETKGINESYSDIFAKATEALYKPGNTNWTIGEDTYFQSIPPSPVAFIRSMQFPKLTNGSTKYGGQNWATNDYYGKAGIQNRWFYLLVNGETGHIDENPSEPIYEVPGIGLDNAVNIAYSTAMVLMTPRSEYKDAFIYSLDAVSSQGFPNPSDRYKAVREAWFAVGVAKRPVVSSFSPTHGSEGDVVVIEGTDFTGISYVAFNDTWVAAPNFIVNDNYTQILIEVPAGATTGPIKLVAGYDTVTTAEDFVIGCETPLTVTVNSTNATSFTAQATGGTEPYTFSLDNQQFSSNNVFTGLSYGQTYTVYVEDDRGCRGEVSFYVDDPLECNVQAGSGGQGTSFLTQNLGPDAGTVVVQYEMYTIPDQMEIYYEDNLVASTASLVSGGGNLTFNYTPNPNGPFHCIIKMFAPNSGTAWDFIAYCPVPQRTAKTSKADVFEMPLIQGKGRSVLYPNPAQTLSRLQFNRKNGSVSITVSDPAGRMIWQTVLSKPEATNIPCEKFLPGAYFVKVQFDDGIIETHKLIKQP